MSEFALRSSIVFKLQQEEDIEKARKIFKDYYSHNHSTQVEFISKNLLFHPEEKVLLFIIGNDYAEESIPISLDKNNIDLIESELCSEYGFEHIDTFICSVVYYTGTDAPQFLPNLS